MDGGGQSDLQKNENEEKEKDKKDPRLERRIRNKVGYLRFDARRKISEIYLTEFLRAMYDPFRIVQQWRFTDPAWASSASND